MMQFFIAFTCIPPNRQEFKMKSTNSQALWLLTIRQSVEWSYNYTVLNRQPSLLSLVFSFRMVLWRICTFPSLLTLTFSMCCSTLETKLRNQCGFAREDSRNVAWLLSKKKYQVPFLLGIEKYSMKLSTSTFHYLEMKIKRFFVAFHSFFTAKKWNYDRKSDGPHGILFTKYGWEKLTSFVWENLAAQSYIHVLCISLYWNSAW